MHSLSVPLLTIDEARARVLDAVRPLGPEEVGLGAALDRVLAQDVVAASDVPPFANSAMDGFAVVPGPAPRRLRIVGEARAGSPFAGVVGAGEAVRISTGAAVPAGAGAVVMVERTTEEDDGTVTVEVEAGPGENVRRPGEDLRAGSVLVKAGSRLGPAELGAAAAAGAGRLRCGGHPRVAVLGTGDELVDPGSPLLPGQIHDSNTVALSALVLRGGGTLAMVRRVPDTRAATEEAIAAALAEADVVIVSGGVSVGPHDHVKPALAALGVQERFWRVALKPGKPTWFGVRGDTLVFGLPGNPVSAMVTFLLFVRPALLLLQGAATGIERRRVELGADLPRNPGRDECVRVRLRDGRAFPTGPQGSHILSSMVGADALAIVPRGTGTLRGGDMVEVERIG